MGQRIGSEAEPVVVFTLDEPRYALRLAAVVRVVRVVEVTPLPQAPEIVLGAINAQGNVIPVLDVRRRFRLPSRERRLEDRFIIARTAGRLVALVADDVPGVRELGPHEVVSTAAALPFAGYLQGVAKLEGGLVLITDLDAFLSLDEERLLNAVLEEAPA